MKVEIDIHDAQQAVTTLKILPRRHKPIELIERLETAVMFARGFEVTCGQCGYEGVTHTNVCPECSARVA